MENCHKSRRERPWQICQRERESRAYKKLALKVPSGQIKESSGGLGGEYFLAGKNNCLGKKITQKIQAASAPTEKEGGGPNRRFFRRERVSRKPRLEARGNRRGPSSAGGHFQ